MNNKPQEKESGNNHIDINSKVIDFLWDVEVIDKYLKKKNVNTKYFNSRTIGISSYLLWKVGKFAYNKFKNINEKQVEIEDGNKLYKPILFFLIHKLNFFEYISEIEKISEKENSKNVAVSDSGNSSYSLDEEIIRTQIPQEFSKKLKYRGVTFIISRAYEKKEIKNSSVSLKRESITIKHNKRNNDKLINFLKVAVNYYYLEYLTKRESISVYQSRSWGSWYNLKDKLKRPINSVFLADNIKDNIVSDIESFIDKKEYFNKKGIPYKRNYLFHGISGTGKTSLIKALGTHFKKSIYFLVFSHDMSNSDFVSLINDVPSNSILVFEDIDILFDQREQEGNNKVSFDVFINCLDGIITRDDIITIMTTNHKEKLDEALLRKGRIDYEQYFGYLDLKSAINMTEYLHERHIKNEELQLIKQIVNNDIKPSEFQNLLLEDGSLKENFKNTLQ